MANKNLTTSYLARLSNANHDGVTQQICDRLTGYTTDNTTLTAAVQEVVAKRQAEDVAFKRYSGKDFASDDLKREDALEDKYMSAALGILNGLLYLPESEPLRRKAEMAKQVFKDFNFSTSAGFEAEARNVLNMAQQWAAATEYELTELGIEAWVQKAVVQANKVLQLVTVRVDHESAKVKGELAAARKATDEAIRQAYDVLNALCVLAPSAGLSSLVSVLLSIEDRAKLYYISGGTTSGGGKPNQGGGSSTGDNGGGSGSGSDDNGGSGSGSGSDDNGGETPGDNNGGGTTPDNPSNPDNPDNSGGDGNSGGGNNNGGGDDDENV